MTVRYVLLKVTSGQTTELMDKAVARDPGQAEVLYDAGVASYKTGKFEQAQAYFAALNKQETVSEELRNKAWYNLGNTQVQSKQLQQAVTSYEQALKYVLMMHVRGITWGWCA